MKRKRSSRGGGGGGGRRRGGSDRRRHSRRGIRRSHFDSSSESSDGGGGGGFADHDQGFERYQRKNHERELGSIQPINSFGPNPGGAAVGGGGSSGSIVDKASARDLLRADVNPMEIDSSVTFDSIGGGKVSLPCARGRCRGSGCDGAGVGAHDVWAGCCCCFSTGVKQ